LYLKRNYCIPYLEKISESGEILGDKYENESRLYLADFREAREGREGGGEKGEGGGGDDAQESTCGEVEALAYSFSTFEINL